MRVPAPDRTTSRSPSIAAVAGHKGGLRRSCRASRGSGIRGPRPEHRRRTRCDPRRGRGRGEQEPADLRAHSGDLSARTLMTSRRGVQVPRPDCVVGPTSTGQLAAVLRAAQATRTPAIQFGGGSSVVEGIAPARHPARSRTHEQDSGDRCQGLLVCCVAGDHRRRSARALDEHICGSATSRRRSRFDVGRLGRNGFELSVVVRFGASKPWAPVSK